MKIQFSTIALKDLFDINKKTDRRFYHGIIATIEELETLPETGRILPEFEEAGISQYREVLFERFRVIYRVQSSRVSVLRILDGELLPELPTHG